MVNYPLEVKSGELRTSVAQLILDRVRSTFQRPLLVVRVSRGKQGLRRRLGHSL